jgi:hypothetical protein
MTGFERLVFEPVRASPAGAHASVKSSIQQLLFVVVGMGGILYALHVASADMATWQTFQLLKVQPYLATVCMCSPELCCVARLCVWAAQQLAGP